MSRYLRHVLLPLSLLLTLPLSLPAQDSARDAKAVAEVRATIRRYDDALRRADAKAAGQPWCLGCLSARAVAHE